VRINLAQIWARIYQEPRIKELIKSFHDEAIEWCHGRSWLVRLPVLIWFIYILINHLINPEYRSILGAFNYWVHEAGHLLLLPFVSGPFGLFLEAMAGTFLECLMPVVFMLAFYLKSDFFGISFCFGWLSTSLFYASWYISTAQITDNLLHDWHLILGTMGLLQYNRVLASIVKAGAVVMMLIGIISGLWLLWQMFKSREERSEAI